jgi:DNA processing protein
VTLAIELRQPGQLPRRLEAAGWRKTLFVRGELADPVSAVAIVGARRASGEGMDRAHALARHLTARSVHVVSGGALGIDGAAHRGAIAAGGPTTVVLGCGVDVAYPERHAPMFQQVLAGGGALVSLVPSGTPAHASLFPQRNPLIAALADMVIVVEADVRSGSLQTASAAKKLGRIVAAWPGSRGCDRLLASGAALVESEVDALAALAGSPRQRPAPVLDPIAQQLVLAIEAGARDVDALVRVTGLPVRAVLRALPQIESPGSAGARSTPKGSAQPIEDSFSARKQ